jgi:hypothetical protein
MNHPPSVPLTAAELLDREFLDVRAKLLQLAASLDRVQRAPGETDPGDPRTGQIREALEILRGQEANRAERVQLAFSLPYDKDWRGRFGMKPSS